MNLCGPLSSLGRATEFDLDNGHNSALIEESEYPDQIKTLLRKKFKKDIQINSYAERLKDVYVYYITTDNGRGDELYYFLCGGRWFHSEIEWSQFHPFLAGIESIKESAVVNHPTFFLGTRNNYTHQTIDLFPSIFLAANNQKLHKNRQFVLGAPNSVFDELYRKFSLETNGLKNDNNVMWLSEVGEAVQRGAWKIRCVLFRDMILVRHLSSFEAFRKMREWMRLTCNLNPREIRKQTYSKIGFIKRDDSRVNNQHEIEYVLRSRFEADSIENIHRLDFDAKLELLNRYDCLVVPPGSDTVNAACFSNSRCHLIQLSGAPIEHMFANPFYSFASLRYFLPFLNRMTLVAPDVNSDLHSGQWSIDKICSELERAIYRRID